MSVYSDHPYVMEVVLKSELVMDGDWCPKQLAKHTCIILNCYCGMNILVRLVLWHLLVIGLVSRMMAEADLKSGTNYKLYSASVGAKVVCTVHHQ